MKGFEVEDVALPKPKANATGDGTNRPPEEVKTEKHHEDHIRAMITTRGSDSQFPKKSTRKDIDPLISVRSKANSVHYLILSI